jgi:hypothetical protein
LVVVVNLDILVDLAARLDFDASEPTLLNPDLSVCEESFNASIECNAFGRMDTWNISVFPPASGVAAIALCSAKIACRFLSSSLIQFCQ